MRKVASLLMTAALTVSAPAAAQEAAGDWAGTLKVTESVNIPVIFHIRQDDAGQLSGTMDSPAQGATGIPIEGITVANGELTFKVPTIRGDYRAQWDAEAKSWKGQWSQGGANLPLDLTVPPPPPPLPANWTFPNDSAIKDVIAARIAPRVGQGVVVGVLGPEGRRVVAGGPQDGEQFNGDTLFEIGSISKVFTALILADMANKGELSLDDPAEKFLPAGHRMPQRGDRKITLRDLSTHMSGLPRLPDNLPFTDPLDPYADYTEALMLAFLDGHELTRDVGERWEYSNLGVGLLGYLLERASGKDYETLVRERITGPLGMNDTSVSLSAAQQARFAPGRDEYMRPTKPWHLATLVGAGGLRSTVNDMLKFAAAALDEKSPIGAAMQTALSVRESVVTGETRQTLGWQIGHPEPGREVTIHNGGTGGYRSALALDRTKNTATVVLTNSAIEPSATDIAMHMLFGMAVSGIPPVPPAPAVAVQRTQAALPVEELDRVVGTYDFGNGVVFEISRDGDGVRAQRKGSATGPVLPIFAEAPLRFYYTAIDAQFHFSTGPDGSVTDVEFIQGEVKLPGKRVAP
jgi:D-alanyl-D-alanine-carboxypeptidase/D-alanyl-D-alanine-endopeptidase